MDRRSFLTALFGGIAVSAAATVIGSDTAQAAALPAETAAALDEAPAEFSQYYNRRYRRPPPPRHYRRHRRYRRW
ncbi:hypothetical protein [Bosea sp. (in: a-proteobacteria)]|uniref:hypothetical protein n=1 Tax=Bosea sp. (in: a-proteobacteria) TaxID=1871050 RepID=UPI002FC70E6A